MLLYLCAKLPCYSSWVLAEDRRLQKKRCLLLIGIAVISICAGAHKSMQTEASACTHTQWFVLQEWDSNLRETESFIMGTLLICPLP